MSLIQSTQRPSRSDPAESPFWISYADLMTALMLLFLVIMVTAIASISKQADELVKKAQRGDANLEAPVVTTEQPDDLHTTQRIHEIESVCKSIANKAKASNPNLAVDCRLNRISFGDTGHFRSDDYRMDESSTKALKDVVPVILEAANTPLGQKWMKQVLIEGYTDTDGSYLYNLNLSLKRSEWVMCTLLQNTTNAASFSAEQRKQIKRLFLAGGVAFNNTRNSKDASRRVELRLQFYGPDKEHLSHQQDDLKFDDDPHDHCRL